MKIKHALILGSLMFVSVALYAQDKKEVKKDAPAAQAGQPSEKEMQAWQAYMTPGEMHKMLESANGEWHEELTFWMAPGAPPTKAEADCNNTMILGGRYQESLHKGMMMGMPFEGRSTVGYDNVKKVFQSSWVDNMGTGIMYMQGKYDPATKSVNFTGKGIDAASGKEENVREVFKFIDDKTQMLEMYMTKDGKEFKTMEIKFTRKG